MLIPYAVVLAEIARQPPLAPRRTAVEAAPGLVAAAPLVAPAAVPERARARRAGFAVAALDLLGASPDTPVVPPARPPLVGAGESLPQGADALLDPGWAYDEATFEALASPPPGAGARLAGDDLAAGAVLAAPGDVLTAARLTGAAAAAIATVETVAPAFRLGGGGAAALFLAATLRGLGCRPAAAGEAPDLDIRFDAALAPRLALEPGAATTLAFAAGRARMALAPTSEAAVGALAILLPLVARWTHRVVAVETRALARKLVSTIGLTEIALLARDGETWRPLCVGDAPLAALIAADALALIDPGCEGLPAGAALAATPLAAPLVAAKSGADH
jgi:molybdopterin biosynthesis enzyme